jgi:hypothetical protein
VVLRRLWAAAVAFHVAAVVLLSFPAPPPGLRGGPRDARTDAALASWATLAQAVGMPDDTFVAWVQAVSGVQMSVYRAIRTVFRPYAQLVGAGQGWSMFGTVPNKVQRLEIDVHGPGGWEALYVARSDTFDWNRAVFDEERVRTFVHALGKRQANDKYPSFVAWVVREVRADRPDADRVRVRWHRMTIPDPEIHARTGELQPGGFLMTQERPL